MDPPARPDTALNRPSTVRLMRSRSIGGHSNNGGPRDDSSLARQDSQSVIDPLSQHIFRRTGNQLSIAASPSSRPRSPRPQSPDTNGAMATHSNAPAVQDSGFLTNPALSAASTRLDAHEFGGPTRELRKGVKAVAFLSRLIGNKKRDEEDEEEVFEPDDARPEGNDAEVFACPVVDNMGFRPQRPLPPAYIKMRSKYKKKRDFDRVFLAQELHHHCAPSLQRRESSMNRLRRKSSHNQNGEPRPRNTVWAMEFSKDGRYLAAAGADRVIRIWAVLSSRDDRQKHETQESNDESGADANGVQQRLSAPVFQSHPVREYNGHDATILDLSWSKNGFLLSSSMDKTVRLWHVSRSECLCTFQHHDFVPSIAFHPKDDRFFLAGSLDAKLRLWSIPDKSVAYSVQLPEMITAVAFTPDGKHAMAGCLTGLCMFFETDGLRYQSQIHVRSTRGQNAKGSKITGIRAQYGASGAIKVLITSNDSRIRVYNFRDKSLELKIKGNENMHSQIRAAVSDDGRYVVCGSEDRKAYIWSLDHLYHGSERRDRTPVEFFEAHNTVTTAVCIAPTKSRAHLARSEDPLYDICNPPPVELLSQAERADRESLASSRPPTAGGSIHTSLRRQRTNDTNDGFADMHTNGDSSTSQYPTPSIISTDRPLASPAYYARNSHNQGNIIVTADFAGRIKVFRQDCAWSKRHAHSSVDDWDRGSIFGKRSITGGGNGKLSRTGSLATRASQRSLRESRNSSSTNYAQSDRYVPAPSSSSAASWRQASSTRSSRNNLFRGNYSPSIDPPAAKSAEQIPPLPSRNGIPSQTNHSSSLPDQPLHANGHANDAPHPVVASVMTRSPAPMDDEVASSVPSPDATDLTPQSGPPDDELSIERQRAGMRSLQNKTNHAVDSAGSYVYWDVSSVSETAAHLKSVDQYDVRKQIGVMPPPPEVKVDPSLEDELPVDDNDRTVRVKPSHDLTNFSRPTMATPQASYLSTLSAERTESFPSSRSASPDSHNSSHHHHHHRHRHDQHYHETPEGHSAHSDVDANDDLLDDPEDDFFDDAQEYHPDTHTNGSGAAGDENEASQRAPLRCSHCGHREFISRTRTRAADYGAHATPTKKVILVCATCGKKA